MTSKEKEWGTATYQVQNGSETFTIQVSGRDRWALESLMDAGRSGCTPINQPAPRWSGYVHNLRALGVNIETKHEPHAGPFPGTHGRYVLYSKVALVSGGEVAA